MNFEKWWKNFKDDEVVGEELAQKSWDAAKEEILRIIFLNTKINGHHSIDIEQTIKEIEKI